MFQPHCNLNENFFNEIVQVFQLPPPLLLVTFVISSKRWRESERGGQSREREREREERERERGRQRETEEQREGGGDRALERVRETEKQREGDREIERQ